MRLRRMYRSQKTRLIKLGMVLSVLCSFFLVSRIKFQLLSERTPVAVANEMLWAVFKQGRGLAYDGSTLRLDGQPFQIFAGVIHYFRMPHQYWLDRLDKLKCAGLNTVDVYVPWNLHEPSPGNFQFTNDQLSLNLVEFIRQAKIAGLYVIIRLGPYVGAELDLGGLPAWLLNDRQMKVRSIYAGFTHAVTLYFEHLLPMLLPLQFSNGGPIVAFQIDDEFGAYVSPEEPGDYKTYIRWLQSWLLSEGVIEPMFVTESPDFVKRGPDIVPFGVNISFASGQHIERDVTNLRDALSEKLLFIGKLYSGYSTFWMNRNMQKSVSDDDFERRLSFLLKNNASFSIYPFHGGTNFAYTNGAAKFYKTGKDGNGESSMYLPFTTSNDYGAPLTESGQMTKKFMKIRELMTTYNTDFNPDELPLPRENWPSSASYGKQMVEDYVTLNSMLNAMHSTRTSTADFMELWCDLQDTLCQLQQFGYVAFRKTLIMDSNFGGGGQLAQLPKVRKPRAVEQPKLKQKQKQQKPMPNQTAKEKKAEQQEDPNLNQEDPPEERVHNDLYIRKSQKITMEVVAADYAMIIVDGRTMLTMGGPTDSFVFSDKPYVFEIELEDTINPKHEIIVLAENMGRVTHARSPHPLDDQRKGVIAKLLVDGRDMPGWDAFALDFSSKFWSAYNFTWSRNYDGSRSIEQPALYRFSFKAKSLDDTFLYPYEWSRGTAFVNRFNVGRYWKLGPQKALYVPAPKLDIGSNEVILFEVQKPAQVIRLLDNSTASL